ncbi:MAG TPA: hypothetical protein VII92_20380 [Anaerolineae bacterium]
MATAIFGNPMLWEDDRIIYVSAHGTTAITKGDWVQYSGAVGSWLNKDASPAFRTSGVGIALSNNPIYDELGRALNNSALPVLRRGIIRVSGGNSGTPPLGAAVYPATTASGIVGQTGATGVGAVWVTAPRQGISAGPTGALASGVGIVIRVPLAGDVSAAQWDVHFDATKAWGYF